MFRSGLSILLSLLMLVSPQVLMAGEGRFRFSKFFRHKPPKETATIQLARTLDDLEEQLNQDGTVVAKSPDIWGEARLTKHRQEFERQLETQLDKFEFRLNAAISRSDQALLASALAIGTAGGEASTEDGGQSPSLSVSTAQSLLPRLELAPPADEQQKAAQNSTIYISPPGTMVADTFDVKDKSINIEPHIYLDQMQRYLNHLHEIRRMNEGDDTADSPGYSLNLVRIPVSIMPGTYTQKNHGAEVTITATPHITEELLPKVFRQLVINDLVDLLSPPIRYLAAKLPEDASDGPEVCPLQARLPDAHDTTKIPIAAAVGPVSRLGFALQNFLGLPTESTRQSAAKDQTAAPESNATDGNSLVATISDASGETIRQPEKIAELTQESARVTLAVSSSRTARSPIAPSNFVAVFGSAELLSIADDLVARQQDGALHLATVRAHLQTELETAYDYLAAHPDLLTGCFAPAVINRTLHMPGDNQQALHDLRVQLTEQRFQPELRTQGDQSKPSVTTCLAWAIAVEAALLNQKLIDDINQVRSDPQCGCMQAGAHLNFANPRLMEGAEEARIFADYVRCRWPIHVFALDPQTQDQNVADSFSMRREMQLALALSFASGEINAQNMTRYVRRLELDMETIALNRTVAAFGHGDDVFGWRFYPRVQSPPFESNTTTVFRDLLRGGPSRDDLRRSWEIEPGMRECTAIVLMPSFITHATFDVRGNFFPLGRHKLKDPSDTRTSIEDTVQMSHKIRLMENAACSLAAEESCYRNGEAQRLLRRVDQVAKKLPLQTVHARVPNENSFGGFEMFSSGVTDLAPELLDYYGQPGVDPSDNTEMFLVGNNFSVHDTRVLAGNRDVEFSLLSRQVMKVTIPPGVRTHSNHSRDVVVDLHIATPYGVSQHLHLPVIPQQVTPTAVGGYSWKRGLLEARFRMMVARNEADNAVTGYTVEETGVLVRRPHQLELTVPPGAFPHPSSATLRFAFSSPQFELIPATEIAGDVNATLNTERGSYVVTGTDFTGLVQKIRAAVVDRQQKIYGEKVLPTAPIEVHLTVQLTPANLEAVTVSAPLQMTIEFFEED